MRRTTLACLAVAASSLALPTAAFAADAVYGITDSGRLIRFNSDSPGRVLSNEPLRGLNAGEQVVGIDVRPSDDHLYAVTSANRAVQVNPVTGAVRPAFGPFSPGLSGQGHGVDFNPVANALRIVSDADQNLRITSGNSTIEDGALNYPSGDPGAGVNPSVTASAYTNSVPSASDTVLFGIDSARDTLVRQDPPNSGTLRTVGALGTAIDEALGFDVAPGGTAYAAVRTGTGAPTLVRVDLGSGGTSPAAERAEIGLPGGAGALRGIAVAGGVDDDRTAPGLSVAFSSTILEQNTDTLRPSISCTETCTITVDAEVQGRDAGEGTGTIQGAGRVTVNVPLSSSARRRIARRGTELISLDIAAVDAAGNRATQNNRRSRTQTLAARRRG